MVLGSKLESGVPAIPVNTRKTIQSIKEVVGDHSDAEIYAMLKETNMDPNETTQRLLNQDPFHEVRRRKDKKKENVVHNPSSEPAKRMDNTTYGLKFKSSWDQNARRGMLVRNAQPDAGISHEFRVVRDNRVNKNSTASVKEESSLHVASDSQQIQILSNVHEKSSTSESDALADPKSLPPGSLELNLQGRGLVSGSLDPEPGLAEGNSRRLFSKGTPVVVSSQSLEPQKEVVNISQSCSAASGPSNSTTGVYSSSSDPVHVPSPTSRSSGAVGAIGREIGALGVRHPSSEVLNPESTVPFKSSSYPLTGKDPVASNSSFGRPISANQSNNKLHQQSGGHQKAHSIMEWKPKLSQKSGTVKPGLNGSTSPSNSSHANRSTGTKIEVTCLSERLSDINVNQDEHVIIPQHLRVPDGERADLTFGSFGIGFDSPKDFESSKQAFENPNDSVNEPPESISETVNVGSHEAISIGNKADLPDRQMSISQADSTTSLAISEVPSELVVSLNSQNTDNNRDIGLLHSHRDSPSHSAVEAHQIQTSPKLPSFSEAYGTQHNYDEAFFRDAVEDNLRAERLGTPSEALVSHTANSNATLTSGMGQFQQPLAHQPVAQLYPQMQFPHYANYLPYRQFLPPIYVPPMAIPNYSTNPAYPHPPNTSNYLLMPGASSHLSVGGVKYATSHYKPIPAGSPTGYGNYPNPGGYTVGTPGSVGGSTVLDDPSRIKYKDSNLYAPNLQAETSEIWVQTPRDISGLPSAPFFNMPGQSPHPAYISANTTHGSFNTTPQSSHVQFQGMYHPSQPVAVANTPHLVHQQLPPSLGGNVGVAAPAPQVGAYQQPQLGHLNWAGNF